MARTYSDEEKQLHLDQYKVSGKSKTEYARDNDIPEATFRAWVKEENYSDFGIEFVKYYGKFPIILDKVYIFKFVKIYENCANKSLRKYTKVK